MKKQKNYAIKVNSIPVAFRMRSKPVPATAEELEEMKTKYLLSDQHMVYIEQVRQMVFGDKKLYGG